MLSEQEKQSVEERLQVYDSLLESDPYFQERLAREADEARQIALSLRSFSPFRHAPGACKKGLRR
jgi:hypothetical protein